MKTEYEVKFYPISKVEYRQVLVENGAELRIPERKMIRTIFESQTLKDNGFDYARVRDEGDKVSLSLKKHATADGNISDQKEVELRIDNFESGKELLLALGMELRTREENLREEWSLDGAQITLDTWPQLDSFTEIEGESEEQVEGIAHKLGFDWNKKIITSVLEIYCEKFNLTREEFLARATELTFSKDTF